MKNYLLTRHFYFTGLFLLLLGFSTAQAQISGSSCVGANGGGGCTAGDLSISNVTVLEVVEGCTGPTDTAVVNLQAAITSGSSQRYDVGIWINEDGTSALSGGSCFRDWLPVADGYSDFETTRADSCGSVGSNLTENRVMNGVTVACSDLDSDNMVELSTCLSWKNTRNNDCADISGAVPGTGSKCRCADVDIDALSIPDMSLTKVCTPDVIQPGDSVSCTITISNAAGAGVLSGVFFVDDYPETYGSISNVVTSAGITADDGTTLTMETGDIAPGTSVTITYDFDTFDENTIPNGSALDTFTNTVGTYYRSASGVVTNQNINASDETTVPVELSFVELSNSIDGSRVVWQTYEEVGNLGFNILLKEPNKSTYYPINPELIPSKVVNSMNVTDYEYEASTPLQDAHYYIQDVDVYGNTEMHGPYKLGRSTGKKVSNQNNLDWGKIRANSKTMGSSTKRDKTNKRNANKADAQSVLIAVENSGLQRVYLSEIKAANPQIAVNKARQLAVYDGAKIVPFYSGTDAQGEYLEFLGEANRTLYSELNYYRIERGQGESIRSVKSSTAGDVVSTYRKTVTAGEDAHYSTFIQGSDPWYDHQLFARGSADSKEFQLDSNDLNLESAEAAQLRVTVHGGVDFPEDNDHDLQIEINGNVVEHLKFDGVGTHAIETEFSTNLLESDSPNTVNVVLTGDTPRGIDLVQIDKVELTYTANINSLESGKLVSASGVLAPASTIAYAEDNNGEVSRVMAKQAKQADAYFNLATSGAEPVIYHLFAESSVQRPQLLADDVAPIQAAAVQHLVIVHPDFIGTELSDYLDQRAGVIGGDYQIANVEEIYAKYSDHEVDAHAIQQHIKLTASFGQLESVLLVGADSFDYVDKLGLGAVSFVPSMYARTSDLVARAPSDSLLADTTGDRVPDVAIGRFSVRSLEELSTMTAKSIAMMQIPSQSRAVLISDSYDDRNKMGFINQNIDLGGFLNAEDWAVTQLSLDGANAITGPELRAEMFSRINQDEVDLLVYNGHSSQSVWSSQGLLRLADSASMQNQRPFASIQWGCWNTYYSSPYRNTLADSLLNAEGGAGLVIGSSTLSLFKVQNDFKPIFNRHLGSGSGSLGEALLDAKREFNRLYGGRPSVILGLNLLGDPTISL